MFRIHDFAPSLLFQSVGWNGLEEHIKSRLIDTLPHSRDIRIQSIRFCREDKASIVHSATALPRLELGGSIALN
jgi:hypothetical protein